MEYKPFRIPSSHPSKPSPQQEGVSIRAYETFTIYMGCFTLGLRSLCFRNNHRRCFEFLATVTTGVLFLSRALKPPVVFIATSVVLWLLWAIFQCRRRWLWWEWPTAGWPWVFLLWLNQCHVMCSGNDIQKTMERSTMLLMGKLTISIGPWLPVRYVRNYQRVAPMFLGMVTIPPKEKMVIFLGDGAFLWHSFTHIGRLWTNPKKTRLAVWPQDCCGRYGKGVLFPLGTSNRLSEPEVQFLDLLGDFW